MRLFTAFLLVAILSGCTDSGNAERILHSQGYTDIMITGFDAFACSKDDDFATGFEATSVDGSRVVGVVCSGWFKGGTVRIHEVK